MTNLAYDFIIIGAGMAGASAGYELSPFGSTLLLEREDQPGYHTTGRSAAFFAESYGNATIRALTRGSRPFFESPVDGFAQQPLTRHCGALYIATQDQSEKLDSFFLELSDLSDSVSMVSSDVLYTKCPVLKPELYCGGVWDPSAKEIDVHTLHHGFLDGFHARGGVTRTAAGVEALTQDKGIWRVSAGGAIFETPCVINAAGAWADQIAALANVAPLGLSPKRRTVITFDAPGDIDISDWPLIIDVEEQFYFKPDSGRLLASPADETPMEPCDVQPEEIDIARAAYRIEQATTLTVRHVVRKWAGLRSFFADKTPTVGFDPDAPGFFWLAGQGGYGIQTAPSMGRLAAALVTGQGVPKELQALNIHASALEPARLKP